MNESEKSLSSLPEELLSLIKSCLFAADYNAFNAVCMSWRTTCIHRPLPPPIHCPFRASPCLIFIQKHNNNMATIFHPIYNDFYSMEIPQLYDAFILSSKYGWLLVSVKRKIFFLNPFTREKIELPNIPFSVGFMCVGFSSPPTSHDCVVIGMHGLGTDISIALLRRGQDSWDTHNCVNNEDFHCSDSSPVLFNGLYYVLGIARNVGVFDPENLTWKVVVEPCQNLLSQNLLYFLLELDGRLVAVLTSRAHDKVHFVNLDLMRMVWQPMEESIGDKKMLYASCRSSFGKSGVVNGMGNKVYLPFFVGNNGVFYSPRTKRLHSFAGGDCSEMQMHRHAAWIEPSFESAGNGNLRW